MMVIETDVLVIGAGPAGSTAAKHAASGGAKVLLMDKKSEIGAPKRCAEGVSNGGLESLGIEHNPRWITRQLDGVRLIAPDGTNVWLTSDKVDLPEAGCILERKVFDKYMAMDAGRAGAEIKIKTLATSMERVDEGFLVDAECMGEKFQIQAKIVIAADGPESRVARWAGLKTAVKPKDMESAAQFEMAGVEMENNNCIEFYFGSVAPGGYAWIFPKGDDIANVGLGVLTTNTDKTAYDHLLDFVKNCPATQNAQPVELNIGGDPVGGMPKKLVTDNLMVVGDAAGQVNPLTGGGIISGMTGGMIAGKVAAEAINEGDLSENKLKEYETTCRAEIGDSINKYLKVKDYMMTLNDDELNSIADTFKDSDFEKISTAELVKKLIKVSPKALLKLGKVF
ncbi:MAG: NAD(P)/FAD-dependent oxidoreductase [Methanobacteriaceae archaeon]|nr:NAD(P)/FAD-dependent oxidoreductase [Methanobacteriaceae archaeon]MDP2835633.1 NAD(P)/FAD-dependent oxidoreductase [Methanobacteriaceae archaeon]MDP3484396.1 NAD(P)/FAD-dependent oxidoreductase [Methanobacteriaceae archaeon]